MEFLATHIGTIFALISWFGVIGIAVAIFVFGVPAALLIANTIGLLKQVFRFFQTPLGQAIGVVLLCLLCLFAGITIGTRNEAKKCRAADLAAQLAAVQRDRDIKAQAAVDADRAALRLQTHATDLEAKVTDYEAQLQKRPAAARCALDSNDVKRLHELSR